MKAVYYTHYAYYKLFASFLYLPFPAKRLYIICNVCNNCNNLSKNSLNDIKNEEFQVTKFNSSL